MARGGDYAWEWPFPNGGWKFPEVRDLLKTLDEKGPRYPTRLDGCQVGVVAPDTKMPMLKPWLIQTSSIQRHHALSRRCEGTHVHANCMGSQRACVSGLYPQRMCEIIGHVILQHTRSPQAPVDIMMLQGSDFAVLSEEFGVEESGLPPVDEADLRRMKEAVRKLHVNF